MVIFGTSREEAAEVKEGEPASAEAEEGLAEGSPEGEAAGLAEGSPAGLSNSRERSRRSEFQNFESQSGEWTNTLRSRRSMDDPLYSAACKFRII